MSDVPSPITPIRIEVEMKTSYLNYSMSVIRGRALPDVRDGLKPVHRRILYAMHREGLRASKKYSKCAGVVGEVLKRYHPHGDSAVYDALVRMAQPWNLRYPLVDGQGNFGSVDGDPAAAYRYTECRMTKLAEALLLDIDQETVSFDPNFDGTTLEPEVMPSAFPNLLVNGSEGIAVGMATKIPPHNLREIIDACVGLIEDPKLSDEALFDLVPGPDFPTGGTIYGRTGIRDAYTTGRGRIRVQGTADFEDVGSRRAIIITEIPYQVNKARLITQIADLVREKRLEGIANLRDESDRRGMRIVVELKQDAVEDIVLNHLYRYTQLEVTFGAIMLAIVNKQPLELSLREMLQHYISHRREVVLRRTKFQLRKAKERAHILEGYRIGLDKDNIDRVIEIIRGSATPADARVELSSQFGLSEIQATALIDMQLRRLTGLERDKIDAEYEELMTRIAELESILASEERLMGVVKEELVGIRDQYGDERRTRIVDAVAERNALDYVAEEDQVVTLSRLGYIKRVPPDEWRMQRRGGMGKKGMDTREEDFVTSIFVANTHAVLYVFTTQGRVYPLDVHRVPQSSRTSRGKPIINLVPVEHDEAIAAVVPVRNIADDDTRDLLFCSKLGLVKRTPITQYRNLRQGGLIACGVAEDDELCVVKLIEPDRNEDIMVLTQHGQCIRFPKAGPKGAPVYGRTARGNKGIALQDGDFVVDMLLVATDATDEPPSDEGLPPHDVDPIDEDSDDDALVGDGADDAGPEPEITLLTVTELGYGKRTALDAYPRQGRNGKGVISHKTGPGIGGVVGAREVSRDDHVMLVTDTGRVIRITAESVRLVKSRSSKGVRLMRLEQDERIVDIELLPADEAEE